MGSSFYRLVLYLSLAFVVLWQDAEGSGAWLSISSFENFLFVITSIMLRILTENIEKVYSLESKLSLTFICSIKTLNILKESQKRVFQKSQNAQPWTFGVDKSIVDCVPGDLGFADFRLRGRVRSSSSSLFDFLPRRRRRASIFSKTTCEAVASSSDASFGSGNLVDCLQLFKSIVSSSFGGSISGVLFLASFARALN